MFAYLIERVIRLILFFVFLITLESVQNIAFIFLEITYNQMAQYYKMAQIDFNFATRTFSKMKFNTLVSYVFTLISLCTIKLSCKR